MEFRITSAWLSFKLNFTLHITVIHLPCALLRPRSYSLQSHLRKYPYFYYNIADMKGWHHMTYVKLQTHSQYLLHAWKYLKFTRVALKTLNTERMQCESSALTDRRTNETLLCLVWAGGASHCTSPPAGRWGGGGEKKNPIVKNMAGK